MSFANKLKNGFVKKARTPQEIDAEYQHHAVNIGHKLEGIRELEEQIEIHRQALPKLKAEMAQANKDAKEKREREAKAANATAGVGVGVSAPQAEAQAAT